MVRRQNELFWNCFLRTEDGHLQCKFCNLKLAGSTSVSRMKSHLSQIKLRGVDICTAVPSEVQEAAHQAIINRERTTVIGSSSRGQNTVAVNQARDVEMERVSAQRMGPAAEEGRNPSFVRTETPSHNVNDVLMPPSTFTDGHLGNDTQLITGQLMQPVPGDATFIDIGGNDGGNLNGQQMQPVPGNAAFIGIGNPSENMNEVLMQPAAASTFAGGHPGNDMGHMTGQLTPQVPVNASNVAIISANMMQPAGTPFALDEDSVLGMVNMAGDCEFLTNDLENFFSELQETQAPFERVPLLEEGESSMGNMNSQLMNQVQGIMIDECREVHREMQVSQPVEGVQFSENGGIAAENISGELIHQVAGGRTAGDRGDVMENMTEVLMPPVEGGRSADGWGMDSENQEQMIQPVGRVACAEGPDSCAHQTKGDALLTEKVIGKAFERNKRRIWECLMKDETLCIGICGMGGAGKSTLVAHINNQLLNMPNPFHNVYWVTVSQDFSIHKLQARISRTIGVDLSDEDDERKRDAKLCEKLKSKQRSVLILDDLWDIFSLVKVGIPIGVNVCKLILTTRSFEICRRMDCQEKNIIKVEPLCEEEAWKLFLETLGHGVSLPPEVREVAKGITRECGGLPLAIITMAGTMKGADHIREWKTAFETLKESEAGEEDMDKDVFRVLKFSYDRLSSTLKQCLLYCALFPEDFSIPIIDLIGHLIAEGIAKGKRSMRADLEEGLAILDKLKRACLLEDCSTCVEDCGTFDEARVRMHDLVRDMAVQILRANSKGMVEAGKQLQELPDEENWKEDLVTVSLMCNNIKEIPSAHSPNCPNLSTLLLCHNVELKLISRSFFEKLNGLNILDLSHTGIEELPDSICDLVNLTSLLLCTCWRLKGVPSLARLKALKKLDLSHTGIEDISDGMEFPSALMHLDLHASRLSNQFPIGILPLLFKLQFLDLGHGIAEAREVSSLKKLEFVRFRFSDLQYWNTYIQSLEGLCTYSFLLAPQRVFLVKFQKNMVLGQLARENEVFIEGLDVINQVGFVALPKDVHRLEILECHELKSLCHAFAFSLHRATQLKELCVRSCDGMEWLHYSLPESLEKLSTSSMNNLCSLLSEDSNINSVIFSNLKKFEIGDCPRMKELFPPRLLPNLHNLVELEVVRCENMVEIIGNGPESSVCSSPTTTSVDFALPKLKALDLCGLPELKSICGGGGKLICNSLQKISVESCPKLKRIPISLPFVELNGQLSPPSTLQKIVIWPREWWDSVEWGHPNEKDALQLLVQSGFDPGD